MNTQPEEIKVKKNWKYYTGIICFIVAFLLPLLGFLVPSLGLSDEATATIITILTVGGPEIMMVFAALLVGKETFQLVKAKIFALFRRKKPLAPVGKTRFYVGLFILFASGIPLYLHGYFPQWLPFEMGSTERLYFLLVFDLIFIFSFIILGGHFWDKFKALFNYESVIKESA